ncbi:hypothetical protein BL250_13540 [Erwinia sp. OLTSP20]|uniref:hypothetical protein n=1 Tax=unclassified Erwinia TaxID=2622719 RepID=UPI000C191565|nr:MULTISPECIES: hypothetical protein [unclassified Erwinia]PIJ48526.1 hypothetical protein BV501_16745 [Erwinia sp. OAMSP11]PIJ69154.1 hypothetical protein BK416_15485 [Erwinia sp. OLSSP12]PIJ78791.1 hypothetical protein BLD47_16695 [Erwinia sp. OLCASP19]PIJ81833.1 hypothetical protein BLD46_12170 [Erwinia sp. OLMTSP26]PIJ82111.1 hypothetical protein BLD49_15795 [Erwinia sp. OLMDSP33]
MGSVKLTVKRLYKLHQDRMVKTTATARIYIGERLIATEQIDGLTESPVSKYIHHDADAHLPLRLEWECDGIADMSAVSVEFCPCCHHHDD